MPLKTQGNNILVQTEEGLVPVPIEEFNVVMVDGQLALIAEENPFWKVIVFKTAFKVTKHAFKRVPERKVTHGVIKTVMRYGKQMYDTEEGTWVFWKDNMINGKGLAVVVNEKKRTISNGNRHVQKRGR